MEALLSLAARRAMTRTLLLLAPSQAAALELLRRLASTGRALADARPMKVLDLARELAEPALLGRGLRASTPGHGALLAGRLLEQGATFLLDPELPRAPFARGLARTGNELRQAGLRLEPLLALCADPLREPEDRRRLAALAELHRRFQEELDTTADSAVLLRAAREEAARSTWLRQALVLVVDEPELTPLEKEFLTAVARLAEVRRLARELPEGLRPGSFAAFAQGAGLPAVDWEATPLGPVAPPAPPRELARLRGSLFEAPDGAPLSGESLELLTAPGEAAEARAIGRRLLREAARGVAFEDMGVIVPRPETYAPLFADLLARLGIPCRLHPSLPLSTGRAARSLLLLFRCRGFARPAVMEFLTFAPVPFEALLPAGAVPRPAQWDALSRDAGVVSGLDRWRAGLLTQAKLEREAAEADPGGRPERRARQRQRADDALALLQVVEALAKTLETLDGEASWAEWASRLQAVLDQWVGPERDREAVAEVIADMGGLASLSPRARWTEVEDVLEARFEWERVPLTPLATGAVHVGVLDAVAGLPFRVVAIPGLVEGGYPGVLRPDPFLLDAEREALIDLAVSALPMSPAGLGGAPSGPRARTTGQLSLLDTLDAGSSSPTPAEPAAPFAWPPGRLPTTQDRLLAARRAFHGAVSQATEKLILSYPRADPRSGRERLPSLFFVAAASALLGRPADASDLERLVVEDTPSTPALEDTLDATERDRRRVQEGGEEAAQAIAAGSAFFKQSRLASRARQSSLYTRYDGFVGDLPAEVKVGLDPTHERASTSASRLATFARCGFQYLLQYVLRLEPALEPEERRRLEPLERGLLFHEVAEKFLKERRDKGELPVEDSPAHVARLLDLAEEALSAFVQGSPPRFTRLWEHEKDQFKAALRRWLSREAASTDRAVPAFFEVGFGLPPPADSRDPHSREPLVIELGDGRTLRVNGKIDRIDRKDDGTLLLRDYKTGKAPRDDGGLFRGGRQLQIPFYILAAAQLFPQSPVTEAFLDYVDAPRRVSFEPALVTGEEFKKLLREMMDVVASGIFVQEPSACDFCDFTAACGPKGILEWRRGPKSGDRQLQRALRLRNVL